MNIIWIDGGLGNQMFQYALALRMEDAGVEVKIDVTKYAEHYAHNGFELERVFGISCKHASVGEIKRLGYRKANHWTELLRKTPFVKKTIYNNESYTYDDNVLILDGRYIEGYWQSEKYFSDIREKIVSAYQFPDFSTAQQKKYEMEMKENISVSVHIRRGDYLRYPQFFNICTDRYYEEAMGYFREKYQGMVRFYIFTNDIPWVEENFMQADCCVVRGNDGDQSFRDMQLMTKCEHNIIANSSFSWWGAWLNPNPDKIVIAPAKWANASERIDVVPEKWIKIKG